MAQKKFDEYFAKVILERCFPEKFPLLTVKDRPDLQYENKIGVEVTNCMPPKVVESFKLRDRAQMLKENTPLRVLERIEQIHEVRTVGNSDIWEQEPYTDDIDESPTKYFLKAVAEKTEKLNSNTAKYAAMKRYELFVNSFISLQRNKIIKQVLDRLMTINNRPRKYSIIYLLAAEQKLLVFDMEREWVTQKYLYSRLNDMAEEANKLMKI